MIDDKKKNPMQDQNKNKNQDAPEMNDNDIDTGYDDTDMDMNSDDYSGSKGGMSQTGEDIDIPDTDEDVMEEIDDVTIDEIPANDEE